MPETRHYCPHCEEIVSLSTLHRHKQLYFNDSTQIWRKRSDVSSDSGDAFEQDESMNVYNDSSLSDTSIDGKLYMV